MEDGLFLFMIFTNDDEFVSLNAAAAAAVTDKALGQALD